MRNSRRTANIDHGSAFQTLRHIADVDWSWREGLIGNDPGETYVWDHGFALDDLPAIHAFCIEEDARLGSYVESLDDAALTESLAMSAARSYRLLRVLSADAKETAECLPTMTNRPEEFGPRGTR